MIVNDSVRIRTIFQAINNGIETKITKLHVYWRAGIFFYQYFETRPAFKRLIVVCLRRRKYEFSSRVK